MPVSFGFADILLSEQRLRTINPDLTDPEGSRLTSADRCEERWQKLKRLSQLSMRVWEGLTGTVLKTSLSDWR